MDIETKLDLIKSEPTEEIITEPALRRLLETNDRPVHYIGLEISGMPHLGTIFVNGKKINDFAAAGVKTNILLSDWHTFANNKLGGDWDKIKKLAGFYRKIFNIVCPKANVVLGSDLYADNDEFWKLTMKFAARTTMARATRTLIIAGRSEKDTLHVSQYMYPIMQAADISALDVDIPHAGMDQRKVNMLALELFKEMGMKQTVPIHHHLLMSLTEPGKVSADASKEEIAAAMKMSKSKPGSAVPALATEDEVKSILSKAWCPMGEAKMNPVLELFRYLILPAQGSVKIERKKEYGGDVVYTAYKDLESDFIQKKLHPIDVKIAAGRAINEMLSPLEHQFSTDKNEMLKLLSQ